MSRLGSLLTCVMLGFAGSLGVARGDILVRTDGTLSDEKVISQDSKEVVVRPEGATDPATHPIDRGTLSRILLVRLKDGRVNPADSYKSDWAGVSTGGATQELGGKGEAVIGTYGRKGLNLDALGLVLAPSAGSSK